MAEGELIPVSYYGIHWENEFTAWLIEEGVQRSAIGLLGPSLFKVTNKDRCPHRFFFRAPPPQQAVDRFNKLLEHDLVRACLPIPKKDDDRVFYVPSSTGEVQLALALLSRLSSPAYSAVQTIWNINKNQLNKLMNVTNVAPLFLRDFRLEHASLLKDVSEIAQFVPRKVIAVGSAHIADWETTVRCSTKVTVELLNELKELPLTSLGEFVLWSYMRGEWNG